MRGKREKKGQRETEGGRDGVKEQVGDEGIRGSTLREGGWLQSGRDSLLGVAGPTEIVGLVFWAGPFGLFPRVCRVFLRHGLSFNLFFFDFVVEFPGGEGEAFADLGAFLPSFSFCFELGGWGEFVTHLAPPRHPAFLGVLHFLFEYLCFVVFLFFARFVSGLPLFVCPLGVNPT